MAVAVLTHFMVMKDPFVNPTGGSSYELAWSIWAFTSYSCARAGKYSLDSKVFGHGT